MRSLNKTVGGKTRTLVKPVRGWGGMPVMPTAKSLGKGFPTAQERAQKTQADIAQAARYNTWANAHIGGGTYDFTVHDFLVYEKRMVEGTDFHWQVDVAGMHTDFYFPGKQHAWTLDSRDGFAPRQTLMPLAVTHAALQSTGIHHINVFIEDLAANPKAALASAWAGEQKS